MKTFITLIAAGAVVLACGTSKQIESGVEEVQNPNIISGEVTQQLYSYDKADTSASSIEYMFYKKATLPYQKLVNQIINGFVSSGSTFLVSVADESPNISEKDMQEALQGFVDEYNSEMELNEGSSGIWEMETMISITEKGSEYVELSLSSWSFSGGAHGNSWAEERIIDMKTGEELLLADFVSDVDEFTRIAEKHFRQAYEIPEDGDLGDAGFMFDDGVFKLNENFLFNPESVEFMYNTYEIAPYVTGPVFVSIPMSEVKHLLKRKLY